MSLLGATGEALGPVFMRGGWGGWWECVGSVQTRARWLRAGGNGRLSCQPRQAPSAWAAGTGRGQASSLTKQGVGVSFWQRLPQSSRPPSPKGGAEGGTHTCLSYARNVVPQEGEGEEEETRLPRGWRLGKGPDQQSQGDPAGPAGGPASAALQDTAGSSTRQG